MSCAVRSFVATLVAVVGAAAVTIGLAMIVMTGLPSDPGPDCRDGASCGLDPAALVPWYFVILAAGVPVLAAGLWLRWRFDPDRLLGRPALGPWGSYTDIHLR